MAKKPSRSRTIGSIGPAEPRPTEDFRLEDQIVRADLRRIAMLAAAFFVFLLALAAVLQ